jgi:hypothetical protein
MTLSPGLLTEGKVEDITDDHECDDGQMRGRLRVHAGHSLALLTD